MANGKFSVKNVVSFEEIAAGKVTELSESDLCMQSDTHVFQFAHSADEEPQKYEVKPGFYSLVESNTGLVTSKIEFKKRDLLENISSTSTILKEAKTFFSRLNV